MRERGYVDLLPHVPNRGLERVERGGVVTEPEEVIIPDIPPAPAPAAPTPAPRPAYSVLDTAKIQAELEL